MSSDDMPEVVHLYKSKLAPNGYALTNHPVYEHDVSYIRRDLVETMLQGMQKDINAIINNDG